MGYVAVDPFVDSFIDLCDVFVWHFSLDVHFQQIVNGGLELCLHKSELLIDLIS
jgi:hypothetical protein